MNILGRSIYIVCCLLYEYISFEGKEFKVLKFVLEY